VNLTAFFGILLSSYSVWNHIAPQITKQILASQQPITKRTITDLSVEQYRNDYSTKEKFDKLDIPEINVRQVLGDILDTDPIIGVPIDGVTNDLKDWARTLKYKVKLWLVNKFVEFNNPTNVVFEFPEEFKPELDTEEEAEEKNTNRETNRYDVEIIDLIASNLINVGDKLYMPYKPRNGQRFIYWSFTLQRCGRSLCTLLTRRLVGFSLHGQYSLQIGSGKPFCRRGFEKSLPLQSRTYPDLDGRI
jgi:hypothetical protein